jgi:serralysin
MAIVYVSPVGLGNGSGSSAANAMAFSNLNQAVKAAGPGGSVLLLADHGNYNTSGTVSLTNGGTDAAPVTLMGVDSSGNPMDIQIFGTRAAYSSGMSAVGNDVFRLLGGANNLVFDGFDFHNVQTGFRFGADAHNITIQNMEADNVRWFINDVVSGTNTSATISGLTIRDVDVHGFSRSVITLRYDTNHVTIEDVFGDSQYENGDGLATGVLLDGTVHNVLIKDSTMMNCIASAATGSYWNGDGFTAEKGVHDLQFQNTRAIGNADGGYDLKASNVVMTDVYAEDNGRNFRLWGQNVQLVNPTGVDPHVRGGTSSQAQVWIGSGATVTIAGGNFVDAGSATRVVDSSGAVTLNAVNVWHASSGTLKSGTGISGLDTSLVHDVTAIGSYSTNGEAYLSSSTATPSATSTSVTGTSGNDVLAATSDANWTLQGLAGNDTLTGLAGNDRLVGGAGNDRLSGGAGDDRFEVKGTGDGFDDITGGTGTDRVVAMGNGTVIGLASVSGIEEISANGFASVSIAGTSGSDLFDFSNTTLTNISVIGGGAGNDTISGSAGADTISGGAGSDLLSGNAGKDLFLYSAASQSSVSAPDRILDFHSGEDRLDLSQIDAVSRQSGNQAFHFLGDAAFGHHAGDLRVDHSDPSVTKIMGDVNGDGVADFVISLSGNIALTPTDFIL